MSFNWILKDIRKDLGYFYIPGLITVFITYFVYLPEDSTKFLILAWIALGLFDAGHVYTTVWRTYLNPNELSRKKNYYIRMPIMIFILFFLWMYLDVPYLGAFIAYFTIYHNLRQFYGMSKWYQKINKSFDKVSDRFLYLLALVPLVATHFRSDLEWTSYYPGAGVFIRPSHFYEHLTRMVFFVLFACWVGYEYYKAHRIKKFEIPRILSVAYPVALYAYCFMYSQNIQGILFPLVVSHGLSYIILVGVSVEKISLMKSKTKIFITVLLTALILGSLEFFFDEYISNLYSDSILSISLAALVLTPLFCHYIYDAFLWRSDHPESKVIVS